MLWFHVIDEWDYAGWGCIGFSEESVTLTATTTSTESEAYYSSSYINTISDGGIKYYIAQMRGKFPIAEKNTMQITSGGNNVNILFDYAVDTPSTLADIFKVRNRIVSS